MGLTIRKVGQTLPQLLRLSALLVVTNDLGLRFY